MYIKSKDNYFSMLQWIQGEEEHFNDMSYIIQFVRLLGIFQNISNNFNLSSYKIPYTIKDWPKLYKETIVYMEQYRKIIENKILKTEFDYFYYNELNNELNMALNCLKILNTSSFYALKRKCENNKNLSYNNISSSDIKNQNGNLYFLDLDNISIDLTIMDLQKFIRYIMNKKEHQWDFSKSQQIIEAYNEYNPLSLDEITIMLSFICFPYKFWKLGRKRYIKHKNYSEEKYMNKLNKILLYKEAKEKFFHDYMKYINNYNKF